MFRHFNAGAVALALLLIQGSLTVNAQTPALVNDLRATIVQAIGAQPESVEIVANGSLFTVFRINSNMNDSSHAGRDNEANVIGKIVSKAIASSPPFKQVHTIRVQYATRAKSGAVPKVLDTIEFRKSPSGSFEFHTT